MTRPLSPLKALAAIKPLAAVFLLAAAAHAAPKDPRPAGRQLGGIVQFNQDIEVGPGDVVEGSVVAFGGSIVVRGSVDGSVVAFNGSITLESGSSVEGAAVSFGGTAAARPGSRIEGEVVELPRALSLGSLMAALAPVLGVAGTFWLYYKLLSAAGWIALSVLLGLLFPKHLGRTGAEIEGRLGACALAGILFWPGLVVVLGVLIVSIIGFPLLPLLVVGAAAAWAWGFAALGLALGGRMGGGAWSPLVSILAGTLLLRALAFVPIFGTVIWLAAAILAPGAALVSRFGFPTSRKT